MIINCPECNKEISDKASSCPHCGYPINNSDNTNKEVEFDYPDLPVDLSVGKQIANWLGDTALKGHYDGSENVYDNISSGTMHVLMCKNGIKLCGDFYKPIMDLHFSQIISLKETTRSELTEKGKSVIGRGIVGAVILGPIGAVVGGMSGIGTKKKMENKNYLVINYWNKATLKPASLLIGCDGKPTMFIRRYEKEKANYK